MYSTKASHLSDPSKNNSMRTSTSSNGLPVFCSTAILDSSLVGYYVLIPLTVSSLLPVGSKSWQLKSFTAFDDQRIRLASGWGADRVGGTNDRGCCQRRAMSDLSLISSTDKLALCHIFHIKGNLYFVSGTFSQWLNICLWKVGSKTKQTGIQLCATLGETEARGCFVCMHVLYVWVGVPAHLCWSQERVNFLFWGRVSPWP